VTTAADALPDDPGMLKAMLLAERAESERLRQIITELQRHRFGRRAESLPEEQLQLALEEAEQVESAGQAESEEKAPAEGKARAAKRRANRGALPAHLTRVETVVDVASTVCPCCSGNGGVAREDLYQIARYGGRCGCRDLARLYPSGEGMGSGLLEVFALQDGSGAQIRIYELELSALAQGAALPDGLVRDHLSDDRGLSGR
jgi:hypothetical protein